MPRYYFHTQNGEIVRDDQGEELRGTEAAREEAVAVLGEILRYRAAAFWTTGRFSVVVTDDAGRTVVTVTATASDSPPEDWSATETPQ